MPLVKISSKHQITIPKEILDKLRLKPGDYVDAQLRNGKVILTPKEGIDKEDDAWFWSEEWQEKERAADEAIRQGKVKTFENVEDLIRDLNS